MSSDRETGDGGFPAPSELELPPEIDGWDAMYPSYFVFDRSEPRAEFENAKTWFHDYTTTEPLLPWDVTITAEAWQIGLSQNLSRVLPIPVSFGSEFRIIAGYVYTAELACTDEELQQERAEVFEDRMAYWLDHFPTLYENVWKPDVKRIGDEIQDLEVPDSLPRYVDDSVLTESKGRTQTLDIIEAYHRLVDLAQQGWQRHFEFLGLSYLTYLEFYEFCKEEFPQIPDNSIVTMVSAVDADVYRPDEKLDELAELAIEMGGPVQDILLEETTPAEKREALEETESGRTFLEAFDEVKDPWFYVSYGDGMHSYHGAWIDDLVGPFNHLEQKVSTLLEGGSIGRDYEAQQEKAARMVEEYRSYITSEEKREEFDRYHEDCVTVYEYAEDHQFWVDHRINVLVARKLREFGRLLVQEGLLDEADDVFFFTRHEVAELLSELCSTWANGPEAFVPVIWKRQAEERKEIFEAAKDWEPAPALGAVPESIDDPLLRMLNGITMEKVERWLGSDDEDSDHLSGFAASSGVVEGTAKVIESVNEFDMIEEGDLLVCRMTNPSWASVLSRIDGAVTNMGGITSHAAVVCREYGVPAVTGAERATNVIQTGDRIRIDGNTGTVEVLDRAT